MLTVEDPARIVDATALRVTSLKSPIRFARDLFLRRWQAPAETYIALYTCTVHWLG